MNGAGFDWLNNAALRSDSELPPPPVSFGFTPTSSSSSLNLVKDSQVSHASDSKVNLIKDASPPLEETKDDLVVPLFLSGDQLSKDEAKTYLRWYNDIVVRRGTSLIRLHDVFLFLKNLNLPLHIQKLLERIFRDCVSLNLGNFFAVLRVISHALLGEAPRRRLITIPAPIVKPKSILSTKRQKESNDDDYENDDNANEPQTNSNEPNKFDLDSFTQFILTGKKPEDNPRPKSKRKNSKRVKFSDEVSVEPDQSLPTQPVKIDLSLPMDQLLNKIPKPHHQTTQPINEEEELKEMKDEVNHFQNVKNVDSALIHGVPAKIPSIFFDEVYNDNGGTVTKADILAANDIGPVRLMSPNHTGPAPLHFNTLTPNFNNPAALQTNGFLSPNRTGAISPSQFADQMLSPSPTGNGTAASNSNTVPLAPTMTGSLSNGMRQTLGAPPMFQDLRISSASPTPPVPPQRRIRSVSSPIPYDNQSQAQQQSLETIFAPDYKEQSLAQQLPTAPATNTSRIASPVPPLPPPPPPPTRRNRGTSLPAPPPPPSRGTQHGTQHLPAVPQRVASDQGPIRQATHGSVYDRVLEDFSSNGQPLNSFNNTNNIYQPISGESNSTGTADILGDLRALQNEVNKLQSNHY